MTSVLAPFRDQLAVAKVDLQRHFPQGVTSLSHRFDRVLGQMAAAFYDSVDCLHGGVHRAIAGTDPAASRRPFSA